jgi:hypothetical protein
LKLHPGLSHLKKGTLCGIWLACLLVLTGIGTVLRAEISEADKKKRDAFLKAREEMHTIASPTPSASPATGKPKVAKKAKSKKSSAKSTPKPRDSDEESDEEGATPAAKKKKSPSPSPTAKPKKKATDEEDEEEAPSRAPSVRPTSTPAPEPSRPPRPVVMPTAAPTILPQSSAPPADITIQKSGLEEEQGLEPTPTPPPKPSFWSRLFGGGGTASYHYLSRGVIESIRRAPVQRSRWKFIIVHNSGTRQGNARAFDYYHRNVRRMKNGMAYHFVVGNGTSSDNGEVEVGDRWRRQINGGHVHSDYLNNISLGICLVGDFNRDRPTKVQLEATEELIRFLRERCGRGIPVRPHREMNPPRWSTDCPGDAFPYPWFRRF